MYKVKQIKSIKSFKDYKKKYGKRYSSLLLSYSKEELKRFDRINNCVGSNHLLEGREWILIDDTYYEIPKPIRASWFRGLNAGVRVSACALTACIVGGAAASPFIVSMLNKVQEIIVEVDEKESYRTSLSFVKDDDGNVIATLTPKRNRDILLGVKTVYIGEDELQPSEYEELTPNALKSKIDVKIKKSVLNAHKGNIKIVPNFEEDTSKLKKVNKIEVKKAPTTQAYHTGEVFSIKGLILTITFEDQTTEDISDDDYTTTDKITTPLDGHKFVDADICISAGTNVTYRGFTLTNAIVFSVTKADIDSIELQQAPTKITYNAGEKFSKDGLKIKVNYKDGTTTPEAELEDIKVKFRDLELDDSYEFDNYSLTGNVHLDIIYKDFTIENAFAITVNKVEEFTDENTHVVGKLKRTSEEPYKYEATILKVDTAGQTLTEITIPSKFVLGEKESNIYDARIIGAKAFSTETYGGRLPFTTVTIPSSITKIEKYAFFEESESFTTVNFADNSELLSIEEGAFSHCSSLNSITIPSGVTSIGASAFNYCGSLKTINIPSGVTSISDSAFSYCFGLESITLPSKVKTIGTSAFKNCSDLKSINIPSDVTSIGNYAFENCGFLNNVTIDSPDIANLTGNSSYLFTKPSLYQTKTIKVKESITVDPSSYLAQNYTCSSEPTEGYYSYTK